MILEGSLSVKAALLAGRRTVSKLYVDQKKDDKDTAFILRTASRKHIPIVRLTREEIDAMAQGRTHGGILAEAGERRLQTLRDSFFVIYLTHCKTIQCSRIIHREQLQHEFLQRRILS